MNIQKTTTYYVVHCDFCKAFNKNLSLNFLNLVIILICSHIFLNLVIILICSHIRLTVSNKLWWLACCHLEGSLSLSAMVPMLRSLAKEKFNIWLTPGWRRKRHDYQCYGWHKREFVGKMLESGLKNILHKLTWARKNKKKFKR